MKIIPTLLFLLLLLSFLSGCQQKDKAARQPEMTVRVAQAVLLKEQTPKEFSFIAKPFRTSELSFRVGGPISNFEVYAGNYYRKGEVIATIDDRDFLIRKEQTQAVYDQAKAEFERIGALYEKNNISASTYEKTKAEYTSAKTAFQTAANELNDTRLVARGSVYREIPRGESHPTDHFFYRSRSTENRNLRYPGYRPPGRTAPTSRTPFRCGRRPDLSGHDPGNLQKYYP